MTKATRSGFTMIQLLMVLALLLLLLIALAPAVRRVRAAAARTQSMNHLKQIGLALHNYHNVNRSLPPAFDGQKNKFSIHVYLLPYIEQENLYKEYMQGSKKAHLVSVYVSPQAGDNNPEPVVGVQNYPANLRVFSSAGSKTAFDKPMPALKATAPGRTPFSQIVDGTSNTMCFATKYGKCGMGGSLYLSAPNSASAAFFGQNPATEKASANSKKATFQLAPTQKQCIFSPLMAQSFTKNGMETLFVDGSARFLSASVEPRTWNSVQQPNDGNVIGGF